MQAGESFHDYPVMCIYRESASRTNGIPIRKSAKNNNIKALFRFLEDRTNFKSEKRVSILFISYILL